MSQGTVTNTFSGPAKFDANVQQHSITITEPDGNVRYVNITEGDERYFEDVAKVVAQLRGKTVEFAPGNTSKKAFLRWPEKTAGVNAQPLPATPQPVLEENIPF